MERAAAAVAKPHLLYSQPQHKHKVGREETRLLLSMMERSAMRKIKLTSIWIIGGLASSSAQ